MCGRLRIGLAGLGIVSLAVLLALAARQAVLRSLGPEGDPLTWAAGRRVPVPAGEAPVPVKPVPVAVPPRGPAGASDRSWSATDLTHLEGVPRDVLLADLGHPDFEVRKRMASELVRRAPNDGAVVPALAGLLGDESVTVRRAAIGALRECGVLAAPALPDLVERLYDPDPYTRALAIMACSPLDPDGATIIPGLRFCLHAPGTVARLDAASVLGQLGRRRGTVSEDLLNLALSEDPLDQRVAAVGLGETGAVAVPPMVELLHSHRADARRTACDALTRMGSDALDAVGPLVACTEDPSSDVRQSAILALWTLRSGSSLAEARLCELAGREGPDALLARETLEGKGHLIPPIAPRHQGLPSPGGGGPSGTHEPDEMIALEGG